MGAYSSLSCCRGTNSTATVDDSLTFAIAPSHSALSNAASPNRGAFFCSILRCVISRIATAPAEVRPTRFTANVPRKWIPRRELVLHSFGLHPCLHLRRTDRRQNQSASFLGSPVCKNLSSLFSFTCSCFLVRARPFFRGTDRRTSHGSSLEPANSRADGIGLKLLRDETAGQNTGSPLKV
jgi:hypothetical protein